MGKVCAELGTAILDTTPCVTFCATDKHRELVSILREAGYQPMIPSEVRDEITQLNKYEPKLTENWKKVAHQFDVVGMESLNPDEIESLMGICDLLNYSLPTSRRRQKDQGEVMVIVHAKIRQNRSEGTVVPVIDDGGAILMAKRVKLNNVIATPRLLEWAVKTGKVQDRQSLKRTYEKFRTVDNSLLPLNKTNLMKADTWDLENSDDLVLADIYIKPTAEAETNSVHLQGEDDEEPTKTLA